MSLFSAAVAPDDPRLAPAGILRFWVLFTACGLACVLVVLKPILGLGMLGAVVGCCLVVYLLAALLGGRVEPMILTWGSDLSSGLLFSVIPREKSIVTLDRMLALALLLAVGFASRNKSVPLPRALRFCAIAWAAFLVAAATSLTFASDMLTSGRLFVEGFCLPTILGWVVVRHLRVEENAATLQKYLLRKAMDGILPKEVLRRRKAAFGLPIRGWLRNELREMLTDMLSEDRIRRRGLFDAPAITKMIRDNRTGERDYTLQLWGVLSLELWHQAFMEQRSAVTLERVPA